MPGTGTITRSSRCGPGSGTPGLTASCSALDWYWRRMNSIIAISSGMSSSTTHAPSRNFDRPTSMATTPVVTAPRPLTSARLRQPRFTSRAGATSACTMPDWLSVKAMKTPTV